MKRILLLILESTVLLTVQVVSVFADNIDASYTLTLEDEKRLMDVKIIDGPFLLTNGKFKEKVPNYSIFVDVAKDFMELHENYNYKDISTETGRKKFEAGLNKYSPDPEDFKEQINNDRISYIISHKLVEKSVFVTSDDCVFQNGNGETVVRGILYFTILEKNGASEEYEKGIEYRVDIVVYMSGSPYYTAPEQFKVIGYDTLNETTVATPTTPAYSASPTSSKVLVNGKTISFEAYNVNGSNYFKLRDLAMAVNGTVKQFEVGWDSANNFINLTTNKAYTVTGGELTASSNPTATEAKTTTSKVYVNGKEVSFTAYNISGSNYFKLRDIAKLIDFGVAWDEKINTISIDTTKVYIE
jgi:hypothetical protein